MIKNDQGGRDYDLTISANTHFTEKCTLQAVVLADSLSYGNIP